MSDLQLSTQSANIIPETLIKSFIEAMPQMAFIADASGKGFYLNRRHYEYFGIPIGDLGEWFRAEKDAHHPEDLPRTLALWSESLKTGQPFEIQYRLKRRDGQFRWHLGRASPVLDDKGQIMAWFGTNTDIHEQMKLTARLEEEREIRERFVATLTHDLRTPLTAAKMSAQVLLRKGGDPAQVKSAARISENIDRADQMIRNLLDANRLNAGQKLPIEISECDLGAIIEGTLTELSEIHGDRFEFLGSRHTLGYWSCDGVRRILENLCINAIKYGSSQGPVTVTVAEGESGTISISVHNMGPTIPPSEQGALFQLYRRAGAQLGKQKGWGLGLTLVKGLADAHGGHVEVTSTLQDGTTFTVNLPIDSRGKK